MQKQLKMLVIAVAVLSCVSGCATAQTGAGLDTSKKLASAKDVHYQITLGPAAERVGAAQSCH